MFEVLGDPERLDVRAVNRCVVLGSERTMEHDVEFGFRQLVDVAEKALSPASTTPRRGCRRSDQLHDLLRRLATRPLRNGVHCDEAGAVRLVVPEETLQGYLDLALVEAEQYGADSVQVRERVRVLRADVAAAALPLYQRVLHPAHRR